MVLQRLWFSPTGKTFVERFFRKNAEIQGQPNVCVLIDVGTRPSQKSLYYLWKAFDLNSNVAGACGEIAAYKGKNWSALLNPLGMLPVITRLVRDLDH